MEAAFQRCFNCEIEKVRNIGFPVELEDRIGMHQIVCPVIPSDEGFLSYFIEVGSGLPIGICMGVKLEGRIRREAHRDFPESDRQSPPKLIQDGKVAFLQDSGDRFFGNLPYHFQQFGSAPGSGGRRHRMSGKQINVRNRFIYRTVHGIGFLRCGRKTL